MVSAVSLSHQIEYPHLKGKPHWRRTLAVYAALDNSPIDATYDELIELVGQVTGQKCSRKLISKWKEERHLKQVVVPVEPAKVIFIDSLDSRGNDVPTRVQSIIKRKSNPFNQLMTAATVLRLASAFGIATTMVGLSWLLTPEDRYQPLAIAQAPSPPTTRKPQELEPRKIKIELTVTSPHDLKVKPGDRIVPGQVLSDRTTERQRLLNQRQQLELSLKQLEIPIPQSNAPKSISILRKLPPVSYQQEEANITLKQQELKEAETAIALAKEKIEQLQKLLPKAQEKLEQLSSIVGPSNLVYGSTPKGKKFSPAPLPVSTLFVDRQSKPVSLDTKANFLPPSPLQSQSEHSIAVIIEHEQAILKQLRDRQEKAKLQLQIAQSQLTTAKEKRQQDEYQLHLEENRRAIALQNQQIELERQRTIRAGQLQEKEYSKAQIQAKIQEVDNAIAQLSTVKAPYSGTVKKVKWKGQTDRTLTVELTLDVDDGSESRTPTVSGK